MASFWLVGDLFLKFPICPGDLLMASESQFILDQQQTSHHILPGYNHSQPQSWQ